MILELNCSGKEGEWEIFLSKKRKQGIGAAEWLAQGHKASEGQEQAQVKLLLVTQFFFHYNT